jgi:nucleotide-binding universal stress UspA family protein
MNVSNTHSSELARARKSSPRTQPVTQLAVGVDGYPEGRDAVALGAAISRASGAAMMLVAVHPDPMVVVPSAMGWSGLEQQARNTLIEARDEFAPEARLIVKTDHSVPRALHRVVTQEHRDLLVVGSSRHADAGHVRIGKRTRQLLCHFESALAVAPRGLHAEHDLSFKRIGVGYDGSPESRAALTWAGALAVASGAELHVRGVIDDRPPAVGWGHAWVGGFAGDWAAVVAEEQKSLRRHAADDAAQTGAKVTTEVVCGRPGNALVAMSADVDLLVVGSRRWGPAARVLLGSTGEAVMHDASCPVVTVPRPDDQMKSA